MSNLVGEMLVGRVGFGESFQACPANYSAEDAMARSIVRLECEADELRAEVAMMREQARILAGERDGAIAARQSSAADWLNQVEQANARVSRALPQVARAEQERDEARELFEASKRARKSLSDACDFLQASERDLKRERDEAREALREIEAAVWKTSGELRGMARRALEAAK